MYNNNDLNQAVEAGIFSGADVEQFRSFIERQRNMPLADEENFKLITSFNDIFVLVACGLLFGSVTVLLADMSSIVNGMSFAVLSWLLAEFFVRKRKMALPGIVLLITFLWGLGYAVASNIDKLLDPSGSIVASWPLLVVCVGALVHWWRFRVPITIAAATVAMLGYCASVFLLSMYKNDTVDDDVVAVVTLISGLLCWLFAMYWDAGDTQRVTYKSDVGFWLHIVASPMIVHSLLALLGVWSGDDSLSVMIVVLVAYAVLSVISVIVDRKVMMVSGLAYAVYAVITIVENYTYIDTGITVAGIGIGVYLLVLSALWPVARRALVCPLPEVVKRYVPSVS